MITISDQTYSQWINQLSSRYRKSQIKAAIKVNREMLIFYWSLEPWKRYCEYESRATMGNKIFAKP